MDTAFDKGPPKIPRDPWSAPESLGDLGCRLEPCWMLELINILLDPCMRLLKAGVEVGGGRKGNGMKGYNE